MRAGFTLHLIDLPAQTGRLLLQLHSELPFIHG